MKKYSKKGLERRKAETFISNRGELIYIIEYIDCNNCTVQFEDGTVLYERKYYDIKKGHIKNPNYPLVYGVGYVGEGVFSFKKNKKAHSTWINILKRCYYEKFHTVRPTYKNVTVCEEWHNFQNFAKWYEENWKSWMEGWHIDKDLLVEGNKVYSPEACCFIPNEINCLFVNNKQAGVRKIGNKYIAVISIDSNKKHLGTFETYEEAENVYIKSKEQNIKRVINKYQNLISYDIYNKLFNYVIKYEKI